MDESQKLRDLFDEAVKLRGTDRLTFVDDQCGHDASLRRELSTLLEAHDASDERLRKFEDPFASTSELPRGHKVGHYRLLERLGEGGMGTVYKARDEQLDRDVALKFLSPHLLGGAESKARFVREAQSAAAIEHPNICRIYEIGETQDRHLFISMAFCEGQSLKALMEEGPLDPAIVLEIAPQIVEGLARIHSKGILHRDIKPANIIVGTDGRVRIVDFGIARPIRGGDLTAQTVNLGTLAYMSPEQISGRDLTEQSDIWSVGVMLYEMVVGSRPFRTDYEQALMYAILNEDPDSVTLAPPQVTEELARIITRCLDKDPGRRFETASELLAALYRASHWSTDGDGRNHASSGRVSGASDLAPDVNTQLRLFISYKKGAEPDERLAGEIVDALEKKHRVFTDAKIPVGSRWARRIEAEISQSDCLIVLLSGESVHSEMILGEVELASQNHSSKGRPTILPIRVRYEKEFEYPLGTYLNDLNWALWSTEEDTEELVQRLVEAVRVGRFAKDDRSLAGRRSRDTGLIPSPHAAAQPIQLDSPEGTMSPQSKLYVERPADSVALQTIVRDGVTITIKGPRQMGKSSLLIRTAAAAVEAGKQVVFLDFQLFGHAALQDANTFFREFCALVSDELDVEDKVEEYWRRPLGHSQRCTRYLARHILKQTDARIVLAMDEVETMFDTSFRSDFFGMLRSWHNDRAIKTDWRRLDLVLVTSTEPYQLIENLNQSPFNVGEVIDLHDFDAAQVAELVSRHGDPISTTDCAELFEMLGGHPYLTRKALYLIASGRESFDQLMLRAASDDGPFGDHLRYHLFRLHDQEDLVVGLKEVLTAKSCRDESVFWRLRGAGLVSRRNGSVQARCPVYEEYFRSRLNA